MRMTRPLRAVAREMLVPVWRTLPWRPLAVCGGTGLVLAAAVPPAFSSALGPDPLVTLLRLTALVGALGAAYLLDDPARYTIEGTPVPRPVRHGLRGALALPLAAGWWIAVLAVVWFGTPSRMRTALPLQAVTLEAVALLACAVAFAAASLRFSGATAAGAFAAPATLGLAAAVWALPERATLLVRTGDPRWEQAHHGWAALLAAATAACVVFSLEPVARRGVRRAGGGGSGPARGCRPGGRQRTTPRTAAGVGGR